MQPTLKNKDIVLFRACLYPGKVHAKHGDIVIFFKTVKLKARVVQRGNKKRRKTKDVRRKGFFIKRIIALPGDKIKVQGGSVYLNGKLLDEPYLPEGMRTPGNFGPKVIPEGKCFVMGDNRKDSFDSRDESFGLLPAEGICGKLYFRIWPLREFGPISKRYAKIK